mgnify:CR=1 FL=1
MTEKTARSLSRDAMAYVLAGGRGSRLQHHVQPEHGDDGPAESLE